MTKWFTKKKEVQVYLFKLGNPGTKRQLKVIETQILNFVHILSKIGFLLLLLSIPSYEQNPSSSTRILGVGQGTIFQIKIHTAVTQTINHSFITPP